MKLMKVRLPCIVAAGFSGTASGDGFSGVEVLGMATVSMVLLGLAIIMFSLLLCMSSKTIV